MKSLTPLLTAAFAPLLLLGCGNERISGSTTETENVLTAVVFSVDSLISDQSHFWHVPTVATLRLDSSNVDFSQSDSLGRDLIVERMDSTPAGRSRPARWWGWQSAPPAACSAGG